MLICVNLTESKIEPSKAVDQGKVHTFTGAGHFEALRHDDFLITIYYVVTKLFLGHQVHSRELKSFFFTVQLDF